VADDEKKSDDEEDLAEGTLISHLVELRQRLLYAVYAVVAVFICLVPFAQEIYTFVSKPMQDSLPDGQQLIAIGVATPFLTPFKTALLAAVFVAMPVVIYQAWRFVAPGLYKNERRFAVPLLVSSIVLFYCGTGFAYFIVFPLVFDFFALVVPQGVVQAPDINQYLDFVLTIFFAFGLAFEVPIATFMLVWSRLVTIEALGKVRPYVFLGAFVVGMFLTPPDIISQTLLAVPMYLLYEGGIIMSRILLAERLREDAQTQ
jgi:sec-independent protein translocase protein TatC